MNDVSVKERLKNLRKSSGKTFDELLILYGIERLLYRLSVSEYQNQFILKGGALLYTLLENKARVTRDIDVLARQIHNSQDNIKEIMDKMVMYHVGKPSDGAIRMSEIVVKCVKHINKSIGYMGSLKKDHVKVEGRVHQVLKLESEADNIYHEEMAKLFTECTDPIEIIKWKEILSAMEDVIDGCEDLVGTFRRVVLKYA